MLLAAIVRRDKNGTSALDDFDASNKGDKGEADRARAGGGGSEAAAAPATAFLPMSLPSKEVRAATLARVQEQLRERETARATMTPPRAPSVPTPNSSLESAFP